ncbi:TetR/AcrR family transcriptional regulator [Nocardia sp. CDC159]|uniref:TetR/AcrR family transcriptional regulator n=1 Tax=Nocardia pulmonis TaxID=2951408 RepID=A0A9X2J2B2_9NOCA|nr:MULTISPECIES: TetR/AcrR family transcriptional regulator [Nocardia]MCM6778990.1 TetR/AcrR family transcriptional regulator [Nocardia pulmonis]MCM6791871.1 TetR/AcrR family transcriptional regulator [Nocardia sp. CDC159]
MSHSSDWDVQPTSVRILTTAAELFAVQGYSGTSTRDIATRVGVQQPAIYKHFAAKDDILIALVRSAVDRPLALAEELRAVSAPAVVKLHRWLTESLRHLHDSPYLLASILTTPELWQDRFTEEQQLVHRLEQVIADLVAAGRREGDIRRIDTTAAARLVMALFDVLAVPQTAVNPADIAEFALAGLLSNPTRLPEFIHTADELALPG